MVALIARGVGIAPFGSGIVVPDWTTPQLWPYLNGSFSQPIVLATGTPGLSSIASDGVSGVWTVSYAGSIWHQPASGAVTSHALPSGAVYVGCAASGTSALAMTSSGVVLTSGGTAFGNFPTYARALAGSGTTLGALLPASGLGTMGPGGVTGLIAFPAGLVTPSCISMTSGNPVAIGGWQPAATLPAANAAALSPTDATVMVAVGSGIASIWRTPGVLGDTWNQTTTLTGLQVLTAAAWTPDGFHVGTVSPTSGVVQILSYVTGAVTLLQSIPVSGAVGIAFGPDSVTAIVGQSGLSQLTPLTFTSVWATGAAVTGVPGITTVIGWGGSGAVAAYSSGLAWLGLASGLWTINSRTALGFTPTLLTVDPFLNVYAAASGQFVQVNPSGTVTASGSMGGVPSGLVVQQGRVAISVAAANVIYLFGQGVPGLYTANNGATIALGSRIGLALSDTTLFAMGSGGTTLLGFSGTPFVLTSVVSGAVAQRAAGAWTVTALGVGHTPCAVGYDSAGHLRVVTTQNTSWTIGTNGTVLSSGVVAQLFGQAQSVPLGISAMTLAPTGMYGATSMSGLLVSIT